MSDAPKISVEVVAYPSKRVSPTVSEQDSVFWRWFNDYRQAHEDLPPSVIEIWNASREFAHAEIREAIDVLVSELLR
jgi:hypothetical protein